MPATVYSITAVDAGTDQLTITGHGFTTGDGFAAIFSPDGGALPGGLAAVTDYWVIVVDPNTVQLAASSADAISGTEIDITSAGSGTLQLLRGLPYRRPRIAVNLQMVYVTTGHRGGHFHQDHRGPGDHPIGVRKWRGGPRSDSPG